MAWLARAGCGLAAAVGFVASTGGSVQAKLVELSFEGRVTAVSGPFGLPVSGIAVGDVAIGAFSYDTTTPDVGVVTNQALYRHAEAAFGMVVDVGTRTFETDPADPRLVVRVTDDDPSGAADRLEFEGSLAVGGGRARFLSMTWTLADPTGAALVDLAPPEVPAVLPTFTQSELVIRDTIGEIFSTNIVAAITSVRFTTPPLAGPTICDGLEATLVGSDGDDLLFGTNGDDVIVTGAGNDRIDGLGGSDVICSGEGEDALLGGSGADRLFGEGGRDILAGGGDDDRLFGGGEADWLLGEAGLDYLRGDAGGDGLEGGGDDDILRGAAGQDVIDGGDGADRVDGGKDGDWVRGGPGADLLLGGDGDDGLDGGDGSDTCDGGPHIIGDVPDVSCESLSDFP